MSLTIANTGTKEDKYTNLLLVGPPKTGKTTFASTAPNPLWWDFDHGLRTVWDKKQPYMSFEAIADKRERENHLKVRDLVRQLKKEEGEFYEYVRDNKVKTHIFDSISAFCDILEADIIVKPWDDKERNGALQIQDYNFIMNRVNQIVKDMIALPYHFVVTAWLERRRDDSNRAKEQPLLSGEKLGSKFAGHFDEVFLVTYDDKAKKYAVSPEQTRTFDHAGSRSHVPLQTYVDPTWDTFGQWWD